MTLALGWSSEGRKQGVVTHPPGSPCSCWSPGLQPPRTVTARLKSTARWHRQVLVTLLFLLKSETVRPPSAHVCGSAYPRLLLSPRLPPSPAFPDPTPASSFRYSGPDVEFEHVPFIICCIYLINVVSLILFVKTDELKIFYSLLPLPPPQKKNHLQGNAVCCCGPFNCWFSSWVCLHVP